MWNREGYMWYREYALEHSPLFIFDPMRDFHVKGESDSDSMSPIMKSLNTIKHAGATIIIVHHQGKGEEAIYRGSENILASCDYMFNIRVTKEVPGNDGTEINVKTIKNRFAPKSTTHLQLVYRCTKTEAWFEDKTKLVEMEEAARTQSNIQTVKSLLINNAAKGVRFNQHQLVTQLHGRNGFGGRDRTIRFLKRWEDTHWKIKKGERHELFYEAI
jgi:hypothetical protein